MIVSQLGEYVIGAASPWLAGAVVQVFARPWRWRWFLAACTGASGSDMAVHLVQHHDVSALLAAADLLIAACLWLETRRRDRDRTGRAAGGRTRAILAGMATKVRRAGKPRPQRLRDDHKGRPGDRKETQYQ
jgi:hypothetical protein